MEKQKRKLYEKDPFSWSIEQANYLRKHQFENLDIEHLVEEIETLSSSDKSSIVSFLSSLMMHLLKIKYQKEKHTKSWDKTIKLAKIKINQKLKRNPGFKQFIPEFIEDAYESARVEASMETGLPEKTFPKECPWTFEELMKGK